MTFLFKLCKKKLHELRPENILWSIGTHGKYQRACKACNYERRKHDTKRIEANRARCKRRAEKKRKAKLHHLNASGIIQGYMLG